MAGRRAARRAARGGERIQASRKARLALAAGALAAYGGAVLDALARAPSPVVAFVPGAGLGAVLLVGALFFRGGGLGAALFLAGATYAAAVAAAGGGADASAPVVAVLLLLCGELAAWSVDERFEIRPEREVTLRRGIAITALALAGLAVATLVVALSAVPPSHGLGWTILGAAAAVGAASTGIWVARR